MDHGARGSRARVGSVSGTIGSRTSSRHAAEHRQRIFRAGRVRLEEQGAHAAAPADPGSPAPSCSRRARQASCMSAQSRGATLDGHRDAAVRRRPP